MAQLFFNARELFASPGYVAYFEGDRVTFHSAPATREMLHAGFWRSYVAMNISGFAFVPKFDRLAGVGHLAVSASVIS